MADTPITALTPAAEEGEQRMSKFEWVRELLEDRKPGDWFETFVDATDMQELLDAAESADRLTRERDEARRKALEEAAKVADEYAQERWMARAKTFSAAGHEVARRIRSLSPQGE